MLRYGWVKEKRQLVLDGKVESVYDKQQTFLFETIFQLSSAIKVVRKSF